MTENIEEVRDVDAPIEEPFIVQKYAIFDDEGFPTAFYSTDICEPPADAVPISDEIWQELIDNQGQRKFTDGKIEEYQYKPSPQELIYVEIRTLEKQVSIRRLREAVLGIDKGWLADLDKNISELRVKL